MSYGFEAINKNVLRFDNAQRLGLRTQIFSNFIQFINNRKLLGLKPVF